MAVIPANPQRATAKAVALSVKKKQALFDSGPSVCYTLLIRTKTEADMGQRILSAVILAAGIFYGIAILTIAYRNKERLSAARGSVFLIALLEALVYFCASVGISDYLLNTLVAKKLRLTDDKTLPGTLVACGLTPGAVIAFSLLRSDTPVDLAMVVLCGAAAMLGSVTGARLVSRFDGALVKTVMKIALVVSLLVLIGKMILSAGRTGTAMGLVSWKLAVAVIICFASALLNMFGIPMKPTWTALFLILGLSPLATLTMVLVLGALCPLSGGAEVIRRGNYSQKLAVCAVTGGAVGAILGTVFAVSLPATLLNVILLAVMLLAIIAMFKR